MMTAPWGVAWDGAVPADGEMAQEPEEARCDGADADAFVRRAGGFTWASGFVSAIDLCGLAMSSWELSEDLYPRYYAKVEERNGRAATLPESIAEKGQVADAKRAYPSERVPNSFRTRLALKA